MTRVRKGPEAEAGDLCEFKASQGEREGERECLDASLSQRLFLKRLNT